MKRVLYIENDPDLGELAYKHFKNDRFKRSVFFKLVKTIEEAYVELSNETYNIIFIDLGVDHAEGEELEKFGGTQIVTKTAGYQGLEVMIMLQSFRYDVEKAYKIVFTGNPDYNSYGRYYEQLSKPKEFKVKDVSDEDNIDFMEQRIKSIKIK